MENEKQLKRAYTEILDVCEKYANEKYLSDYAFEDVREMRDKAKNHLLLLSWYEKYGLDIKHDKRLYNYNYVKLDDYRHFSYFSDASAEKEKGSGRYISWEDDDKQPKDEWLFSFSFSSGAYIFGDDYPTQLFEKFWHELKSFNPDYCDSHNHSMYFKLENAKKIYDSFQDIMKKYYELNREDAKTRKIEKLKEELSKLEDIK